jgi:hypothetical protein
VLYLSEANLPKMLYKEYPTPAPSPARSPTKEKSGKPPETKAHPKNTANTHTVFLKVIFSLKITDEKSNTKIGAVYKSIAAADAFSILIALK